MAKQKPVPPWRQKGQDTRSEDHSHPVLGPQHGSRVSSHPMRTRAQIPGSTQSTMFQRRMDDVSEAPELKRKDSRRSGAKAAKNAAYRARAAAERMPEMLTAPGHTENGNMGPRTKAERKVAARAEREAQGQAERMELAPETLGLFNGVDIRPSTKAERKAANKAQREWNKGAERIPNAPGIYGSPMIGNYMPPTKSERRAENKALAKAAQAALPQQAQDTDNVLVLARKTAGKTGSAARFLNRLEVAVEGLYQKFDEEARERLGVGEIVDTFKAAQSEAAALMEKLENIDSLILRLRGPDVEPNLPAHEDEDMASNVPRLLGSDLGPALPLHGNEDKDEEMGFDTSQLRGSLLNSAPLRYEYEDDDEDEDEDEEMSSDEEEEESTSNLPVRSMTMPSRMERDVGYHQSLLDWKAAQR